MTALIIAATVGFLVLAAYFSPLALRQVRNWTLRKVVTRDRILALTYDDGPSEALTPRILDLLQQHGAKATFFILARNASKYPHIVDRILREGHDIGCHSD